MSTKHINKDNSATYMILLILYLIFHFCILSTYLIPHKVSAAHSPARHLDSQSRTASVRGRLASLRWLWCHHWHCGNIDLSTFFVWFVVRVVAFLLFVFRFYFFLCNKLLVFVIFVSFLYDFSFYLPCSYSSYYYFIKSQ